MKLEIVIREAEEGGRPLLDLLARLQPLAEEFPDVDDTLLPLDDVEV